MSVETSVIIRTRNEARWIGECLKRLTQQTYQDFEIILIDSGSDDETLEIAQQFSIRLFQIKPSEFTYPRALNFGCRMAYGNKYFCILSGHSLPSSRTWLQDGIRDFSHNAICGVYGPVFALPDASIWEKIIFNKMANLLRHKFIHRRIIRKAGMGVLGNTNALIRRDLWEQHHFDEFYAAGGEDGAWAAYWLAHGYVAMRDFKFGVYHSHGLGLLALYRQLKHWKALAKSMPFVFPDYRKDKAHS